MQHGSVASELAVYPSFEEYQGGIYAPGKHDSPSAGTAVIHLTTQVLVVNHHTLPSWMPTATV